MTISNLGTGKTDESKINCTIQTHLKTKITIIPGEIEQLGSGASSSVYLTLYLENIIEDAEDALIQIKAIDKNGYSADLILPITFAPKF